MFRKTCKCAEYNPRVQCYPSESTTKEMNTNIFAAATKYHERVRRSYSPEVVYTEQKKLTNSKYLQQIKYISDWTCDP